VPRPPPLTRKRVWWLLSDFLVVPTQQYWFRMNIDYMLAWRKAYFIGLCAHLDDVALFHWIFQDQDCWLSTTKKSLNSYQTLFLMREQGLSTRLTLQRLHTKLVYYSEATSSCSADCIVDNPQTRAHKWIARTPSTSRGSRIDVPCRSVCDRDQNGIKRSTFFLGADQGIKTNSERLKSSDQRNFSDT